MNQNDTYFLENSPLFSGKIRQVFNYSQDKLLIKTSDKISAFDFVFDDEVTTKGSLLTKITKFWFNKTQHIIKNQHRCRSIRYFIINHFKLFNF